MTLSGNLKAPPANLARQRRAPSAARAAAVTERRQQKAILKTGALQTAILDSANFSSIATDEKGVNLTKPIKVTEFMDALNVALDFAEGHRARAI